MKKGDIQADKVFPITEEYHPKRDYIEQLRQAGYLQREADWTEAGPFKKFSLLPRMLRIPALTVAYTVLIIWFMATVIRESAPKKPRGAKRHGKERL